MYPVPFEILTMSVILMLHSIYNSIFFINKISVDYPQDLSQINLSIKNNCQIMIHLSGVGDAMNDSLASVVPFFQHGF